LKRSALITGSPGGVGKKRVPPRFLDEGDIMEVQVEPIGRGCGTTW
jgi:2-keto-4-pentenoate hydratase/2-oxohepta-3-ene-1,7-dioic acid hydratase in catechol pathway